VRRTLVLNPSTPLFIARFNTRFLRPGDLEDIAGNRALPEGVRRACESALARKNRSR
jgi:hypothetical protein